MSAAPFADEIDWPRAIGTAHDFVGAKLALFLGNELLTYRRDRKPDLPYPGCWDLPGGGREGDETPFECAARELLEEFGLSLAADRIVWARSYPGVSRPAALSWFMAARMEAAAIRRIRFGDEGEEWRMADPADFLGNAGAVPYLRSRLADYIGAGRAELVDRNAV